MRRTKRAALLKSWFQTDLGRKNSASYCMVTRWSRSSSNFNALISQNLTGEFVPIAGADRISWRHLAMFSTVFFHQMEKINTAAIKIPLLFMAGLIIEFLVQKCAACQSHWKPNLGCHPFRFSPCLMRKRVKKLKRFWPYLKAFRSCILTGFFLVSWSLA